MYHRWGVLVLLEAFRWGCYFCAFVLRAAVRFLYFPVCFWCRRFVSCSSWVCSSYARCISCGAIQKIYTVDHGNDHISTTMPAAMTTTTTTTTKITESSFSLRLYGDKGVMCHKTQRISVRDVTNSGCSFNSIATISQKYELPPPCPPTTLPFRPSVYLLFACTQHKHADTPTWYLSRVRAAIAAVPRQSGGWALDDLWTGELKIVDLGTDTQNQVLTSK